MVLCILLSKSLLEFHLHIIITGKFEAVAYQPSKVMDLNLQGWSWSHRHKVYVENLKCELEVHVRANPHQRSLRGSELNLVIAIRFTTNWYF